MSDQPSSDLQQVLEFTERISKESGEFIMRHFRSQIDVERKSDNSPVTIADKGAEELIRNAITKEFPGHGIIGEEFGNENTEAEYVWVIDPIDGTKSFITGTPLFGTLIALCRNMEPILGVINLPALSQRYIGTNDQTTCNGNPVHFRECASISNAVVLMTDYIDIARYLSELSYEVLLQNAAFSRTWGDCYGYTLLCSGFADVMIDPIMAPWDIYALVPVVRGAGGTITDVHGNNPLENNNILAAHPSIHRQIVNLLNPS